MVRVLSAFLKRKETLRNTRTQISELLSVADELSPIYCLDPYTGDPQSAQARYLGINIDVSGSSRLFKGESQIIARLQKRLMQIGFLSRISIAATLGCAWGTARYGEKRYCIIRAQDTDKALQPLPVRALRIDTQTEQSLLELNLHHIGELLSLSRPSLSKRFPISLIHRLDQARGSRSEAITPIRIREPERASHDFEPPLKDRNALLYIAEGLLDRLIQKARERNEKIAHLSLQITPAEEPKVIKNFLLSRPSHEKKHIWSLLKLQLEKYEFHTGISSLTLLVPSTEHLHARQASSLGEIDREEEISSSKLAELIDTLAAHLGHNRLCRVSCRPSHIPEHSFFFESISQDTHQRTKKQSRALAHIVQSERPSLLFHTPHPIRAMAMLPDSPPFWLMWRGEKHQIVTGIGPERIAPEWWGEEDTRFHTRDYFKVQLPSGSWLWIYRRLERSEWFVHGVWV